MLEKTMTKADLKEQVDMLKEAQTKIDAIEQQTEARFSDLESLLEMRERVNGVEAQTRRSLDTEKQTKDTIETLKMKLDSMKDALVLMAQEMKDGGAKPGSSNQILDILQGLSQNHTNKLVN